MTDLRALPRGRFTKESIASWALTLTPAAVALGLYLPTVVGRSIGRDSGVFLYAGQEILRGGFPYVDAWDHKGPLLYLFNAAGALIAGGDIFGVLLLEAVLVVASFVFFSVSLRNRLGFLPVALAGSFGAVTYFMFFEGGNFTETWTFPFALIAYSAFVRDRTAPSYQRWSTFAGVSIAVALAVAVLIRPSNALGLAVLALAYSLAPFTSLSRTARRLALLAVSSVAILAPILGLVARAGALDEMWDQYIVYNVTYSSTSSLFSRAVSLAELTGSLAKSPIVLGLAVAVVIKSVRASESNPAPHENTLFGTLVAALLAESLGVALSGRGFAHYLVTVIPVLTLLSALVFSRVRIEFKDLSPGQRLRSDIAIVSAGLVVVLSLGIADNALNQARRDLSMGLTNPTSSLAVVTREIVASTRAEETVYVWGAETGFLAGAQRRSASSITYLYPVILPNPTATQMKDRLVTELEMSRPRLVVRTANWPCPFAEPCPDPMLAEAHRYIADNYSLQKTVDGVEFWERR